MKRRSLLSGVAGLGALLAGCSRSAPGAGGGSATTTESGNDTAAEEGNETATEDGNGTATDGGTGTATGTVTTRAGLAPGETEFRALGTRCRSGPGGAAVTFADGEVRVDGRVEVSDGCYTAALEGAATADGTLTVRVASKGTGGACVQCLSVVEYEAAVGVAGDGPERVVVTHDGTEVARAERGE